MSELLKNTFFIILMMIGIYMCLIELTNQIIEGKI
jgi:hypothetical protein